MSNSPKTRPIQKIFNVLKKKYEAPGRRESLPVLEHLIMAVLADGTTTAKSEAVFQRLKSYYYDWNELRVSAVAELQEQLADLPDPEQRAVRLKNCLKFVFETTYGFDLEQLKKLPMKELAKRFEKMPGVSDYLINRLIRDGLGGTAVPLDSTAVRCLTRLGIIDEKTPPDVLAASLARQFPRPRSFELCHLLDELGNDTCVLPEPNCKPCCLLDLCPTGQRRLKEIEEAAAAAAAAAREKRSRAKSKRSRTKV